MTDNPRTGLVLPPNDRISRPVNAELLKIVSGDPVYMTAAVDIPAGASFQVLDVENNVAVHFEYADLARAETGYWSLKIGRSGSVKSPLRPKT